MSNYPTSRYELLENHRSKAQLVHFTNRYVATIKQRLKKMPIMPVSHESGEVRIISYPKGCLSVPVADMVASAELTGSTAILCQTNQEAAEIHGILLSEKVPARLIQSAEGFNLINLLEVRSFVDWIRKQCEVTISKEMWEEGKRNCKQLYQRSRW